MSKPTPPMNEKVIPDDLIHQAMAAVPRWPAGRINDELAARGLRRVTRQAISYAKERLGYEKDDRRTPHHRRLLPWVISEEHTNHPLVRFLRTTAQVRSGRQPKSPGEARNRVRWIERLSPGGDFSGKVIAYTREGGPVLVDRRVGIDRDLIREPINPETN